MRFSTIFWFCLGLVFNYHVIAQSGVKGNTFIHGKKEMVVFKPHNFVYGGSGLMPGIVCTKRNRPTYLSFSGKAAVVTVSDAAHVDGYVKNYDISEFTFPIGDNGRYCPVSIRAPQMFSPVVAAYFGVDPSVAATSILLGGMEPPLPLGAPFSNTAMVNGVRVVSNKEYWDVNGGAAIYLTLHWSQYSAIDTLTEQVLDALHIVGWDGKQWVYIPSSVEPGSSFNEGKITTDLPIIPDTYNVFTFGASCDKLEIAFKGIPNDLYLCNGEQITIDVKPDRPSQVANAEFILQIFENGAWKDVENSISGNFTFIGYPPIVNERKYRIKWTLTESCDVYSQTFSHYPYRTVPLACLGNINVTLGHDCELVLTPSMLLSGADLSGFYEIKIMDNNGNTKSNPLTYPDLNQTYMVTVVEKCSGNSCWSTVFIEDKIKPIVDCGSPQNFECTTLDLVLAEKPDQIISGLNHISSPPFVKDNCNNAVATFKDKLEKGACGEAVVFRDWKFLDLSGNSAQCTQELRFTPVRFDQLLPPQKEITLSCGQSVQPDDIAAFYDMAATTDVPFTPYIENHEGFEKAYFTYLVKEANGTTHAQKVGPNACNIYAVYDDQYLSLCAETCGGGYKIVRTWTLYNDCDNSTMSYVQFIKVMDVTGPQFVLTGKTVDINATTCTASTALPKPENITDNCTPLDLFTWRVHIPAGSVLNGTYPDFVISGLTAGQHKIQYIVSDCCGNETIREAIITVNENKPVAFCKPVTVMWDPTTPKITEFWARDFDAGSTDFCTAADHLIYTFDGVMPLMDSMHVDHYFSKNNNGQTIASTVSAYQSGYAYRWQPARKSAGKIFLQMGQHPINITVTNQAGLMDDCHTYLHIIDVDQTINISGKAATEYGRPLTNVKITIDADHPDFPQYHNTKADGNYQFTVPVGLDYSISAAKGGDFLNGVSTLDLVLIQRHILGLQPHDTPYKVIASDGTDNSRVSATDLTEIRKLILGVKDTMINQSWRFPVSSQNLDKNQPFPFAERYSIEAPLVALNDINFTAVKIGDVDGNVSVDVNSPTVSSRTNGGTFLLGVHDKAVTKGDIIRIPVKAKEAARIFGFQATWETKNAIITGVEGDIIDLTDAHTGKISDSLFTMSVSLLELQSYDEGAVLFTLTIKALQDGLISEILTLSSAVTPAEAYFEGFKQGRISLSKISDEVLVTLLQNEPNPFAFNTKISFYALKAVPVTLRVMDVGGKIYINKPISAQVGPNAIELTNADLPESGIYFYTIEGENFKETRKMLRVE